MQPLDYHSPEPNADRAPAGLVVAPLIGAAATAIAVVQSYVEEPFGIFSVSDAIIQVGNLPVAVGLWAYWSVIAWRSRLSIVAVLPSLAWAILHLRVAIWFGLGYFSEPWNY